ncbi:hypothetical protein BDN72DRAFT_734793, partial [Pluteus cervinus]
DLIRLSRTCKFVRGHVLHYMKPQFSLKELLGPYFEDEEGILNFRTIQNETGALIVDSTAYHFLDRSLSQCTRLDLLVTEDECGLLIGFLEDADYTLNMTEY